MEKTEMNLRKLLVLIPLLAVTAFASCGRYTSKNDFTVVVHGSEAEITGYTGSSTEVRIPPRIEGLPVTKIGAGAFKRKGLTSVTIPRGVAVIGEEAFYSNELTSVIIPDSVTAIERAAFFESALTHVTIPNSVTQIGHGAFAYNKLGEIIIPDRITSINGRAFANNRLTSVTIPEGVVSIGEGAFEGNSLMEIIIPESVTSIGRDGFDDNDVGKVTIGENVEFVYDGGTGFVSFYNYGVRRRGGVYFFSNYHWSPEDKTIPVFLFDSSTAGRFPYISFLADMPDLEYVALHNNSLMTDITPLSGLTNLKKLQIIDCPNIKSLEPLSGLTKLKELFIFDCPNIKSLEPLSSLTNLECLTITHNKGYDYSALASLRQLERLSISKDLDPIDLKHLGRLRFLKTLYFGNGSDPEKKIMNIHELQDLVNLENLIIIDINDLDISWASSLRNLTTLELSSCTISDLSPLVNLPNLVDINFPNTKIKDLSPLAYSNSIKYIHFREDNVEADINDHARSLFVQKNINLDTFYDDR
jgi:Leucine-rich repeat (LRR) protein